MAEAEFVMFDKVAASAVGKPLLAILRQKYPGCATVDEMASLARHDVHIPAPITHLVGQKYKLMVSISKKWKLKNGEDLSFQVNRIDETYKPELPLFADVGSSGSTNVTSGTGVCGEKIPILGPLTLAGSETPPPTAPALGSPEAQVYPTLLRIYSCLFGYCADFLPIFLNARFPFLETHACFCCQDHSLNSISRVLHSEVL